MKTKSSGFTLIELLVVIATVTILAAALLSALGAAREKVHGGVCKGNQRQIIISYQLVLEEDKSGASWWTDPEVESSWGIFDRIHKGGQLYICPCAPWKERDRAMELPWDSWIDGTVDSAWCMSGGDYAAASSYTWNGVTLALSAYTPGFRDRSMEALIKRPVLTPFQADGVYFVVGPTATDLPAQDLYTGKTPDGTYEHMATMTIPRHGSRPRLVPRNWPVSSPLPGAVNVGFFDGHVEVVKLDRLWDLEWDPRYYLPPAKRPGLR